MKYNGIIQRKLALLDTQVQRLKQHTEGLTVEQFVDDWVIRSMTERAIQVCTEIMIDIDRKSTRLNSSHYS